MILKWYIKKEIKFDNYVSRIIKKNICRHFKNIYLSTSSRKFLSSTYIQSGKNEFDLHQGSLKETLMRVLKQIQKRNNKC